MRRKIFRLGKSTLVASLPSKWIKKYGISDQDELEVTEKERSITFSTDKEHSEREIEIDIKGFNKDLIVWYITAAYVRGFDRIKVLFEDHEESAVSHRTISDLIGVEVIEQGESYLVGGEITGATDAQFDNILRRIFLLIISISEDSFAALGKNKRDTLKGIDRRDVDIDKFINFCLRILNKKGYKEYAKTPVIYDMIQELEELANNYRSLALDLLEIELPKTRKDIKEIYFETNKLLRELYEVSYKFNKEKVVELYNQRMKVKGLISSINNLKSTDIAILYHLRKINANCVEILKLRIAFEF